MSAKITVSFIYQYYNSDEAAFNFLVDDILQCTNHSEIKYFIHKYEVKEKIIKNIKFVTQDNNIMQFTEKEYNVPDYHFDLLLAKNKWTQFFKNYVLPESAGCNIVFSIQHSNGYGIKNNNTRYVQNKEDFNAQIKIAEQAIIKYRLNIDLKNNEGGDYYRIIPYFVLADAIKQVFETKKLDLLFLNNCYSQTFEAGLVFSKCANYLGSSQSTLPGFGVNFKEFFALLEQSVNNGQHLAIEEMAKNLTTNFKQKFAENRIVNFLRTIEGNENKTDNELSDMANLHTFSINSLEKYPALLESMNVIIETYTNAALCKAIFKVREEKLNCQDVSLDPRNELSLIDMFNFFEQISKELSSNSLLVNFLKSLKDVVVDSYIPDIFYNPPSGKEYYKIMPHGISLFLPHSKYYNGYKNERQYSTGQLIFNLMNKNIRILEIETTKWSDLLNLLINTNC